MVDRKRRQIAEQKAKARRDRPMSQAGQRDFMRTFIKNQSSAVYNKGWTMTYVKSLSADRLKETSNNNVSDSCAQSVEIDRLKQTLSEHLKEKESLMQTVTLLKNNFKKEESRKIDREIVLEKKIKQLDNINSVNSPEPTLSSRPTKVEVPKELPKVSMVSDEFEDNAYVLSPKRKTRSQRVEKMRIKVIKKLKERIKSLSGKMNEDKIKKDLEKIETINIKLDHRVSKLIAENEHLKQTYKQLYDSIKPARIRSKEQYLKDDLRKLKGKVLVDNDVTKHPSDPELLKIDVEPITPKLLNKKIAHSTYIKHTQEEATVLRDLVEHVNSKYPLDHSLKSTCRYAKLIQELLTHINKTCPSVNNADGKLVAVTPKNKDKRVRFTKPVISSRYTITKTASTSNLVSNKPMSSSTGVKLSTSACGSQPSGNTKKDKNRQTPSSTHKNKVEAHPRKVESGLKNKACIVKPKGTAYMQHSKLNANSELKCVKCNGCMLSDNHDLCVLDFINNVNAGNKSKSVKQSSKRIVWKLTGKVITTTTEVPLRKPTALENETPKLVVTLVYSRKPRKSRNNVPISKSKVVQIVLWYLDSGCSKHMTRDLKARHGLVRGLPKLKFEKDHLCSACAMEKSKKKSHKPKSEEINQEKLYLLHMDLCGPMRVASVNGKKYILVIFDDYSPFTWVKYLRSKDEALDFIIKFLKMIQVRLKVHVRRIRTDNGTEFVNQTLRKYYEKVGISHETSVAHSL
ncbi:retrovirus-related pol polyprotein from transposon TNT 1-94 [Tanacetum coccineum]|uniref:Retrovirus-related pol polyprotein from transposon TNT 1-94 n=1 Tax=Tanacetum coccineum TaxID=301880 RepID=A0ABQ5E4E5_9ASTR